MVRRGSVRTFLILGLVTVAMAACATAGAVGTPVTVQREAPLGDPVELRVRNYALSIRRADALGIEVE